jgi:hypothetical protein
MRNSGVRRLTPVSLMVQSFLEFMPRSFGVLVALKALQKRPWVEPHAIPSRKVFPAFVGETEHCEAEFITMRR